MVDATPNLPAVIPTNGSRTGIWKRLLGPAPSFVTSETIRGQIAALEDEIPRLADRLSGLTYRLMNGEEGVALEEAEGQAQLGRKETELRRLRQALPAAIAREQQQAAEDNAKLREAAAKHRVARAGEIKRAARAMVKSAMQYSVRVTNCHDEYRQLLKHAADLVKLLPAPLLNGAGFGFEERLSPDKLRVWREDEIARLAHCRKPRPPGAGAVGAEDHAPIEERLERLLRDIVLAFERGETPPPPPRPPWFVDDGIGWRPDPAEVEAWEAETVAKRLSQLEQIAIAEVTGTAST